MRNRTIFSEARRSLGAWVLALAVWLGGSPGSMHMLLAAEPQGALKTATKATKTAGVEPIPLTTPDSAGSVGSKSKYQLSVGGGDWQPVGVVLATGEVVEFHASGKITLSDGHSAGPDGVARGWTDLLRLYPMSSADSGALIGRLGTGSAGLPFLIGSSRNWTVPASGPLYLRINLSPDLTAEGNFQVSLRLQAPKPLRPSSGDVAESFLTKLSPALFAEIPRRVQDQQHDLGDMVNFALVGEEQQVQTALAKAGWIPTDPNTQDALLHGLIATLSHKAYTEVPMSTLYLFGRPEDLAYARANAIEVAATRDHMRLWKTTETVNGVPLWVGSATHDHGFETDQRTGGVTHHIDPNIDQERDFILASLKDAGEAAAAAYIMPSDPVRQAHTATGGSFSSDGRILVILLR
jgi:hypothetical protein